MKIIHNIGVTSALLVATLASGTSVASTWTVPNSITNTTLSLTAGSGPSTVTTSAFYATTNTSVIGTATPQNYSGNLGATSGIETRTSSPNHALDNNGNIETIMFTFGTTSADKVNLTGANFGWVYANDSDFSVYAYTGLSATPTPAGLTYSNLTTNGWTEIGHYNSGGAGNRTFANSVYSSYWLIGALNGLVTDTAGRDTGDDYFKIASVSGNKYTCTTNCGGGGGKVPEPGTLLLMGAGLFGLTRFQRTPRGS